MKTEKEIIEKINALNLQLMTIEKNYFSVNTLDEQIDMSGKLATKQAQLEILQWVLI